MGGQVCPHCNHAIFVEEEETKIGLTNNIYWDIRHYICPNCGKVVVKLLSTDNKNVENMFFVSPLSKIIYPTSSNRSPVNPDVPKEYAEDFTEACLVESLSPKASAALSRRCLQNLLHGYFHIERRNLAIEIEDLINNKCLPTYISMDIDAVRNIGNFAAHPTKSTDTGLILPVEQGEAGWILNVLESLFDFCFIQPKIAEKKREQLNAKLAEADKPPLKKNRSSEGVLLNTK